jgi:curved DNA-binding protein CbpA
MSDTHYSVLGVSEAATQSEIKAAYRDLLKKIHPDTASTLSLDLRRLAEGATKDITEAYSVLSDASKRRQYDLEFELGEHRLKSVRPPTTPAIPRGPQLWPQTSPAASNSRRRRHVHHYENNNHYSRSRLRRWAYRHPAFAGLLVFVIGILCVVISMLFFSFACGGTSVCVLSAGSLAAEGPPWIEQARVSDFCIDSDMRT